MAAALQYGSTGGYEPLVAWIESLQTLTHGRTKGEGWAISIGSGSQDLLYKVCPSELLCLLSCLTTSHFSLSTLS